MTSEFWATRLERAKQDLAAVDARITSLESSAASYSIDSGQSRQSVTQHELATLYKRQERLMQLISDYEVKAGSGSSAFVGRPAC